MDGSENGFSLVSCCRYQANMNGKCKYTRSFKPIHVAQYGEIIGGEKKDAMKVERFIKSMNKKDKEALVKSPKNLMNLLSNIQILS